MKLNLSPRKNSPRIREATHGPIHVEACRYTNGSYSAVISLCGYDVCCQSFYAPNWAAAADHVKRRMSIYPGIETWFKRLRAATFSDDEYSMVSVDYCPSTQYYAMTVACPKHEVTVWFQTEDGSEQRALEAAPWKFLNQFRELRKAIAAWDAVTDIVTDSAPRVGQSKKLQSRHKK